jgi:hypothetical protein
MEDEQRVIIKFLTNESVDAHEIYIGLSAQFGEPTYTLRRIQFWVHEIQRGRRNLHGEHRSELPAFDYIDAKIISRLEKAPFESARSIAEVLNVDHSTVLYCLHEKLGFKSYCLQWVPHLSTGELRAKRKEFTGLMIPDLEVARKDGWRHLVIGDESWFCLLSDSRRMCQDFMQPIFWVSF